MQASNAVARIFSFENIRAAATPNGNLVRNTRPGIAAAWLITVLAIWTFVHVPFLPGPAKLFAAFNHLWWVDGIGLELVASLKLYFSTMAVGIVISGALAFLARIALFAPPIYALTSLRFLSMAGVNLFFMIFLGSSYRLKFVLMVFYQAVMLLKPMLDTIKKLEKDKLSHARTIYKSPWKAAYEVIVLGCAADFLMEIQTNQSNGWTMLFIVEGISLSDGGIGSLMVRLMKNPDLAKVTVMLVICMAAGILFDRLFRWIRIKLCPYADLKTERA